MSFKKLGAVALAALVATGAAEAKSLKITVTNLSPVGGFGFTPVFLGFHDGSYDAFTTGETATAGLETLAELGGTAGVAAELAATQATSQSATVTAAGNGVPPIEGGEMGMIEITLDPTTQRFLTYLSMVIPSNDTFIGNGDPEAIALFDEMGNFNGNRTITITGNSVYDAGTEENDATNGPAFVAMIDAMQGGPGEGAVSAGADLSDFAGVPLAPGGNLTTTTLDLSGPDRGSIVLGQIQISAVPLPATAPMLLAGLGLAGAFLRRRKS